jgi:hypothetical protein
MHYMNSAFDRWLMIILVREIRVLSKHKLEFLSDNFFLLACLGAPSSGMSKSSSSQMGWHSAKKVPSLQLLSYLLSGGAVQRSILSELPELCKGFFLNRTKIMIRMSWDRGRRRHSGDGGRRCTSQSPRFIAARDLVHQ